MKFADDDSGKMGATARTETANYNMPDPVTSKNIRCGASLRPRVFSSPASRRHPENAAETAPHTISLGTFFNRPAEFPRTRRAERELNAAQLIISRPLR